MLVTDRIDLDEQIWKTFHQCGKEPQQAKTGAHLQELLDDDRVAVITTVLDKFRAAAKAERHLPERDADIFVLVDESHRSQYGTMHAKMQRVFPNACYIGFTGTPLMKKEKNTARKFGGFIEPAYTIRDAVADEAVVPLLYEGRHVLQDVNQKAVDSMFEAMCEGLSHRTEGRSEAQIRLARRTQPARKPAVSDRVGCFAALLPAMEGHWLQGPAHRVREEGSALPEALPRSVRQGHLRGGDLRATEIEGEMDRGRLGRERGELLEGDDGQIRHRKGIQPVPYRRVQEVRRPGNPHRGGQAAHRLRCAAATSCSTSPEA